MVEGFDVGRITNPENPEGQIDYDDFRDFVNFSLSNNLRNLIWDNNKEYDIIYVDWANGLDYLQRNAYALETAIAWVNTQKAAAGSTEQNVILGQSMGGVIARWALADMEENSIAHDTRLFISHDAPQQGANIPLSIQYMYRHVTNQYIRAGQTFGGSVITIPLAEILLDASSYLSLLDVPATQQLLKTRSTLNYTENNTEHDAFYNELQGKGLSGSGGYPINTRNIALSNGSECGDTQNFAPSDLLFNLYSDTKLSFLEDLASLIVIPLGGSFAGAFLDSDFFSVAILGLIPGNSRFNINFWGKAVSYRNGTKIYNGNISYSKRVLWLGPTIVTHITKVEKNQFNNMLPYDYYGGGFYNVNNFVDPNNLPSQLFLRDRFNFIPTASALDIGNGNVSLLDQDYLKSYVGGNPPVAPKNTPFNNFSTEFEDGTNANQNRQHISFNNRSGDWLAAELNDDPEFTNCSFICQGVPIFGDNSICFNASETYSINNLPADATINWEVSPAGGFTMIDNGNSATLTPTGNFSGEATLTVTVDNDCGTATATKSIQTGSQRPIIYDANGDEVASFTFCMLDYDGISFDTPPGAVEWQWTNASNNFAMTASNNHAQFYNPTPAFGIVTVKVRDNCGWSAPTFLVINLIDCSGGGGFGNFRMTQNPIESETLTVIETEHGQSNLNNSSQSNNNGQGNSGQNNSSQSNNNGNQNKVTLEFYDFTGNLLKTKRVNRNHIDRKYHLNVSRFSNDNYFIRIIYNEIDEIHQVILDR